MPPAPPPCSLIWNCCSAATLHTHIPFRVKTSRGKLLVSNWKTDAACLKAAALYFAHKIKYKSKESAKTRCLLAVYRDETVNTCYKLVIKNRNVGSTGWTSGCRRIRTLSHHGFTGHSERLMLIKKQTNTNLTKFRLVPHSESKERI